MSIAPILPTEIIASRTQRIIYKNSSIYLEDKSIYKKRSCLSKFFLQNRYNSNLVLKNLCKKINNQLSLNHCLALKANLKTAFRQAKKHNKKFKSYSPFVCFLRGYTFTPIKNYKKCYQELSLKIQKLQLVELKKQTYEIAHIALLDTSKNNEKEQLVKAVEVAKKIKNVKNLLKAIKYNSHSSEQIELARSLINEVMGKFKHTLEIIDGNLIKTCLGKLDKHSSGIVEIKIYLLFLLNIQKAFLPALNAIKQDIKYTFHSISIIDQLIYEAQKTVSFNDKYPLASCKIQCKLIIRKLFHFCSQIDFTANFFEKFENECALAIQALETLKNTPYSDFNMAKVCSYYIENEIKKIESEKNLINDNLYELAILEKNKFPESLILAIQGRIAFLDKLSAKKHLYYYLRKPLVGFLARIFLNYFISKDRQFKQILKNKIMACIKFSFYELQLLEQIWLNFYVIDNFMPPILKKTEEYVFFKAIFENNKNSAKLLINQIEIV